MLGLDRIKVALIVALLAFFSGGATPIEIDDADSAVETSVAMVAAAPVVRIRLRLTSAPVVRRSAGHSARRPGRIPAAARPAALALFITTGPPTTRC